MGWQKTGTVTITEPGIYFYSEQICKSKKKKIKRSRLIDSDKILKMIKIDLKLECQTSN